MHHLLLPGFSFLIANRCSGLISKGLSSPQILIICIWKVFEADLRTQIFLGIFGRMNKLKWGLSLESVINISFFKLLVRKDTGFFFSSKNCHWSLNGIMKKLKTHSVAWKQINEVPGKEGRLFFKFNSMFKVICNHIWNAKTATELYHTQHYNHGSRRRWKKVGGIGVFALQYLDYFHISCGLVEQVSLCFHFGSANNSHVP